MLADLGSLVSEAMWENPIEIADFMVPAGGIEPTA
jgi:hypothetical protein